MVGPTDLGDTANLHAPARLGKNIALIADSNAAVAANSARAGRFVARIIGHVRDIPLGETPMFTATRPTENALASALYAQRWLVGITLLHSLAVYGTLAAIGAPIDSGIVSILGLVFSLLLPTFLFGALILRIATLAMRGTRRPTQALMGDLRAYLANRSALLQSVIAMAMITLLVANFSVFKGYIPRLNPFAWDAGLAQLDRALHFGFDPWQLLMPILSAPQALKVLDTAYSVWFLLIYFSVFIAVLGRSNTSARHGYLIAFTLLWALGGNGLATVFASAGPIYFDDLGLGSQFAALTAHIRDSHAILPINAPRLHEVLWAGYAKGGAVTGISAFPSMHVASSVLMALFAFSYARWAGWMMVGFACTIMAGSVMLAWHYAVDGYAGAALAYVFWRAGKGLAARA